MPHICMCPILRVIHTHGLPTCTRIQHLLPMHAVFQVLNAIHMHVSNSTCHTYAWIAYIHTNSTHTTNACSFSGPKCHTYACVQLHVPYIRIDCHHAHEFNTHAAFQVPSATSATHALGSVPRCASDYHTAAV